MHLIEIMNYRITKSTKIRKAELLGGNGEDLR